jgi:hypothetical protein
MPIHALLIGPILELGKGLVNRFFPDPVQAAAAQLELLKMAQTGELAQLAADAEIAKAQIAVNSAEASSGNAYASSWRPTVGYVCVAGLFYTFLLQPLLPWFAAVFGLDVPPLPPLDTNVLMTLLLGMLGIGGMRTAERMKGVTPPGK